MSAGRRTYAAAQRWWNTDRAGVLDFAVIFPFVLLLTLAIIQVGLYFHARSVAIGASESSLRQASAQYGSAPAGTASAYAFIAQAGGTTLQAPLVVTNRTPTAATVNITGKSISLVPWVNFTVTVNQHRSVERVTYPGMG